MLNTQLKLQLQMQLATWNYVYFGFWVSVLHKVLFVNILQGTRRHLNRTAKVQRKLLATTGNIVAAIRPQQQLIQQQEYLHIWSCLQQSQREANWICHTHRQRSRSQSRENSAQNINEFYFPDREVSLYEGSLYFLLVYNVNIIIKVL